MIEVLETIDDVNQLPTNYQHGLYWLEISLKKGCVPSWDDDFLSPQRLGIERYHAFYDEPWNPYNWVLRIAASSEDSLLLVVQHYQRINAIRALNPYDVYFEDEVFGSHEKAKVALRAFQVAFDMRDRNFTRDEWTKVIHCMLNAGDGLTTGEEVRWALGFTKNRAKRWFKDITGETKKEYKRWRSGRSNK